MDSGFGSRTPRERASHAGDSSCMSRILLMTSGCSAHERGICSSCYRETAPAAHEMTAREQKVPHRLMQSTLLVALLLITARAGFVHPAPRPHPSAGPLLRGCAQEREVNKSGTRRGSHRRKSDGAHASDRHAHGQLMRISLCKKIVSRKSCSQLPLREQRSRMRELFSCMHEQGRISG